MNTLAGATIRRDHDPSPIQKSCSVDVQYPGGVRATVAPATIPLWAKRTRQVRLRISDDLDRPQTESQGFSIRGNRG